MVTVYLCEECHNYIPDPIYCFHCRSPAPTDTAIPVVVQYSFGGVKDSKALIVVCSPKCQKEIGHMIKNKDLDLIHGCNHCGNGNRRMKKCSRCKVPRYCSKECQLADWPKHKITCKKYVLATAK